MIDNAVPSPFITSTETAAGPNCPQSHWMLNSPMPHPPGANGIAVRIWLIGTSTRTLLQLMCPCRASLISTQPSSEKTWLRLESPSHSAIPGM